MQQHIRAHSTAGKKNGFELQARDPNKNVEDHSDMTDGSGPSDVCVVCGVWCVVGKY